MPKCTVCGTAFDVPPLPAEQLASCPTCQTQIRVPPHYVPAPFVPAAVAPTRYSYAPLIAAGVVLSIALAAGGGLLLCCGGLAAIGGTAPAASKTPVTLANFQRVQNGMTTAEVSAILGDEAEIISETSIGNIHTVMVAWHADDFGSCNVTFQDGRVVMKAQFGLH